ncbi:hypothetical protein C0995_006841 [Termitomyces sp. Mi166|nr:hypothetical protein C0995_006841 [Termitomyces sp. Mi166\
MAKYQYIYAALKCLALPLHKVGWDRILQVVTTADVSGITALEDKCSEGLQSMSWIWRLKEGNAMEGEGKQEVLYIEWCKARAHAYQWKEECLLLDEEMQKVIAFVIYQEGVWKA